jgi:hypothetical protein
MLSNIYRRFGRQSEVTSCLVSLPNWLIFGSSPSAAGNGIRIGTDTFASSYLAMRRRINYAALALD